VKRRRLLEAALDHWPAKVLSLAAAAVLFFFYRASTLEERNFSVPLNLEVPAGLAVSKPYPRSVRVTLRGRSESVFAVLEEDIIVNADLDRFSGEGDFRVPLRVQRKGSAAGVEPLEVRVEPAELRLSLEKEIVRTVQVQARLKGQPEHGYDLVQYSVAPMSVEVSGPRSAVESLESVDTEEVDVTGVREDFSLTVPLKRENSLVRYPREASVLFRAVVRPAQLVQAFQQVDVVSVDLPAELRIAEPLPKGSISLQGEQLALEAIPPGQLRLIADCGGVRRPGVYRLPLKPDVPPGFVVVHFEPREFTATFVVVPRELPRGGPGEVPGEDSGEAGQP
jgi:hypothetical protein